MTTEEIDKLIDRYFAADTTIEEERILKKLLLSRAYLSDKQKETLAIMGYFAHAPKKRYPPVRLSPKYAAAIIALIALIASFDFILSKHSTIAVTDPTCVAYVKGVEINDKAEIMGLVTAQLAEMSKVSEEITDEVTNNMNELRNALNLE